jgi:hypothetical protein
MIEALPPHRRRFLALALLAGLLLTLWMALIEPVAGALRQALSGKIQAQRLLAAHQREIAGQEVWQDAYRKVTSTAGANVFIRDRNANLAAARFQTEIKQALEQYKASIGSIQALPLVKEPDVQRATVRASFTVPVKNLEILLIALARKSPAVFLDNLVITSPPGGKAETDQAPLSIQCDFISYILAESA